VEEVKKLRIELGERTTELQSKKDTLTKLQAAHEEATQKVIKYEEQLKNVDEFKVNLEAQRDKAEKQKDKSIRELERLQAVVGEWEVKLVNLKVELVNTVDKLNTQEIENLHLKESLDKLMSLTSGKKKK
jgi:chromosome segregation ATPase